MQPAAPRRSRISQQFGLMTSPQTLWRGKLLCSSSATDSPRLGQNAAAVEPAGPPPTTMTSNSFTPAQHDAGVDAAETEAVGQNEIHVGLTADVWHAVEICVRFVEMERRRQEIVFDGKTTDRRLNRSGRSERMSMKWFRGAYRHLPRAENLPDCQRLRGVAQRCAGRMSVDVADGVRRNLRVSQRVADAACGDRCVGPGREHVIGVVVASVTKNLG